MIALLKKKNQYDISARDVYAGLLTKSRNAAFYKTFGVPDSFGGRFDLLTLHAFILIYRANKEGVAGLDFGQALFDAMFADMDQTLREMGIGDMGVPKRMKRMMKAFNGRMHAYEAAAGDDAAFSDALRRNIYATVEELPPAALAKMTDYARRAMEAAARISLTDIAQNRMVWPEFN